MFCSKCGNQITDDSRFCEKCGNQVRADEEIKNSFVSLVEEPESENEETGSPVLQFVRSIPFALIFVAFILPLFVISCPATNSEIGSFSTYQSLDLSTTLAELLNQLPADELDSAKKSLGSFSIAVFSVLLLSAMAFGFSFYQRIIAAILGIVSFIDFAVILASLCGKSNQMIEILPGSGGLLSLVLFVAAVVLCFIPAKYEMPIPLAIKITLVVVPTLIVVLCSIPSFRDKNFVKDARDGQKYKTVQIGTQTWMAQNLNYKIKGKSYDPGEPHCDNQYGCLYSAYEAGFVCMEGWRLPSIRDFNKLFSAAGGKSVAGENLKSKTGWTGYGNNGADLYGFAALPAGTYESEEGNSHFSGRGRLAAFWTSTKEDENDYRGPASVYVEFRNDEKRAYKESIHYYGAKSVRCVKK